MCVRPNRNKYVVRKEKIYLKVTVSEDIQKVVNLESYKSIILEQTISEKDRNINIFQQDVQFYNSHHTRVH